MLYVGWKDGMGWDGWMDGYHNLRCSESTFGANNSTMYISWPIAQ